MSSLGVEPSSWGASDSTRTPLILLCIAVPFLMCFGKIVYNLYFHPLRNYPGPLLARATGLWYAYYLGKGATSTAILDAHNKYGDIVRLSPTDLDYVAPEAWKDIFGHHNGMPENHKDPRHVITDDMPRDSALTAGHVKHAQLRRLLANAFSDKTLRTQEPVITKYVDLLVKRFGEMCENGGEPLNIVDWYNYATFDIIGHLAFDEPFDCLENSAYHPWVQLIFSHLKVNIFYAAVNRITDTPILNKFLKRKFVPKTAVKKRTTNNNLAREKLLRRKQRSPEYTDFMTHLIAAEEKGILDMDELDVNARLLVIAGSETTATLLSGATWFLLNNPEPLAKLTAEIRNTFKSIEDINFTSVNELRYMLACLDESLRLYPPVSGTLIRVIPPQGAMVCGEYIPGGTSVGVNVYSMGHSAANWERAEEFIPERHVREEAEKGSGERVGFNDRREAFQPFSYGPRNCIGRNLAYIEMRLILAKVLWKFDLELCPGNEDPVAQKIYGIWEKKPIMVKLKLVER